MIDAGVRAVLASPRRLDILWAVWRQPRPAGDIHRLMPDVTFGAVSQHLRALASAGLVSRRADGRRRIYAADRAALAPVAALLESMWDDALWRLKRVVELEAARRGPRPASAHRRAAAARSPRSPVRPDRQRRRRR